MKILIIVLFGIGTAIAFKKRQLDGLPVVQLSDLNSSTLEGYGMMSAVPMNGGSEHSAIYKAPSGHRIQVTLVHTADGICSKECEKGGVRVDIGEKSHIFCCASDRTQPVLISDTNEMVVTRETILNEFQGPWNIEYLIEMTK